MLHFKAVAMTRRQRIGDAVLCLFGFVVMIYTTSLTIMSWVQGEQGTKQPGYCDK